MESVTSRLAWSWAEAPRYSERRRTWLDVLLPKASGWDLIGESASVITLSAEQTREFAFAAITQIEQDNTVLNSLAYILGRALFKVDCVKAIYFDFDEEQTTISVWTILEGVSEANRRKVYEKELELLDEFPSFVFNFRTTDTSGEEMPASSGYRLLER